MTDICRILCVVIIVFGTVYFWSFRYRKNRSMLNGCMGQDCKKNNKNT